MVKWFLAFKICHLNFSECKNSISKRRCQYHKSGIRLMWKCGFWCSWWNPKFGVCRRLQCNPPSVKLPPSQISLNFAKKPFICRNLLKHSSLIVKHFSEMPKRFNSVLKHFNDFLKRFNETLKHTANLLKHFDDLLKHCNDLL